MTATDGLPPLREVIERHGLFTKRSLGQNFLLDLNLTGRIARSAGDLAGVTTVEIGPGPGGLTRALLMEGATGVIAIERDDRALPALAEIAAHHPGRLEIVAGDALRFDLAAVPGPVKVVANLPYNVATPLLAGWLEAPTWPPNWQSLTLMFQREVAERIVAAPGDDAYGRLGVLAGWRTEARILFDIDPRAFFPPPKVVSSVVQLVPRQEPLPAEPAVLARVTAAAFGQRRKMLRQSLKSLGMPVEPLLAAARIEGTRRAEEIDVAGFVRLANAVAG
ncbi:MAG: 16S rRNA (adenine(1518)-N(6)/adenine(1519)-N(6))-dimethyltransferase RsmA [Bauldia sp.]